MAGVYLSYPFCAQKCTYCNFASGVFPRGAERRYVQALSDELRSYSWPWWPETVYLGGGTPSILEIEDLRALLALVPGRPWREATMEAAPGSVTPANGHAHGRSAESTASAWACNRLWIRKSAAPDVSTTRRSSSRS